MAGTRRISARPKNGFAPLGESCACLAFLLESIIARRRQQEMRNGWQASHSVGTFKIRTARHGSSHFFPP
jgi:hypothetical protein